MNFDTIRLRDLERYSSQPDSILIDLRDTCEYSKDHIPNAVNIPYEDMEERIGEVKGHQSIILYCERGNLSLLAARDLARAGCRHLYSLYGGYLAYKRYYH